jgi:ring-1,2-phenylacetyl-CoA epoxidase subunit PaaE
MAKFHSLTVKEVRRETEDCVSVAFDVPNGEYEAFQFIQGQYLTLKTTINGEDVRRSYSLCSSPLDDELRVAIKKVEGGRFSTFANEVLKAGDTIEAMPPMGHFYTELDPSNQKHYVAFAAGSGITPVMSILKTVLLQEPNSQFTLFYGNRGADAIIFKEELEALKNKFLSRFTLHFILSREHPGSDLFYGRIDKEKCNAFCNLLIDPDDVDHFFICGPEPMIHAVKETLEEHGATKGKVHFELFTSPVGPLGVQQIRKKKDTPKIESSITITLDGNSFSFDLPSSGATILDAALKGGADLPFACKGGVCCTCKAKVLEGEVEMDVNYALEPDEVEAGYVLTCQSHPITQKVSVSFDD